MAETTQDTEILDNSHNNQKSGSGINTTTVVNVKVKYIRPKYKNLEEWLEDPNNVNIGRGNVIRINNKPMPPKSSKWANPFKIGKDGTREDVIAKYKEHITKSGLIKDIEELRGKNLGCWCKPEHCHGDILLEFLEQSK